MRSLAAGPYRPLHGAKGRGRPRKATNACRGQRRTGWASVKFSVFGAPDDVLVSVEVLGPDVGYQVETENRPFDGISTDIKDNEQVVWIPSAQ